LLNPQIEGGSNRLSAGVWKSLKLASTVIFLGVGMSIEAKDRTRKSNLRRVSSSWDEDFSGRHSLTRVILGSVIPDLPLYHLACILDYHCSPLNPQVFPLTHGGPFIDKHYITSYRVGDVKCSAYYLPIIYIN